MSVDLSLILRLLAVAVNKDVAFIDYAAFDCGGDAKFAEQDARFEKRFVQIDTRFAVQGNRIDVLISEMNGKFRLMFWMPPY